MPVSARASENPNGPRTPVRFSKAQQGVVFAFLCCIFFTFAFVHPEIVYGRGARGFTPDNFYVQAIFRFHVALAGTFLASWLVQPTMRGALSRRSLAMTDRARRSLSVAALSLLCLLFAAFVVVFGRWQFGGFDYNILSEIGWRQILGQRPYVDFPTTTPPLFNLGLLMAFRLFGVSWDAVLALTALFTTGTLAWLYCLLRRLEMSQLAALGTACTVEIATMLSCCFWWYNDTTLVLAALFFTTAVLLARRVEDRFAQVSYVASFALLVLAKPNIAGVTIAGCVALLMILSRHRFRIVLLTFAGAAIALLILQLGHVSLPAMMLAYSGAAKERGPFSSFGFDEFSGGEKLLIQWWYVALCLPLLGCLRPLWAEIRGRRAPQAAFWLFFPLSALIAIYGLRGNGELRDVETAVLLCGLSLLAFCFRAESLGWRRYTTALLCGMCASNLYSAMARHRVYTIGPHLFFEWKDRDHLLLTGPLKHMRVSETFAEVNQEIQQALESNPGPYFFGPRVDYGYMAFGVPPPKHFPAWWHPGTAFARTDMHKFVARWEQDRFPTLIYFKGVGHQDPYPENADPKHPELEGEQSSDYTYYPASMLNDLRTRYIRDDRFPRITVYHRRPGM